MKIHEVIGSKVGLDIRDGGNNFFCMKYYTRFVRCHLGLDVIEGFEKTPRLGMSSCTVREPMTLQAEHLGIRFYPYPLVYAIGGHAKPSQRRERVEETHSPSLYAK